MLFEQKYNEWMQAIIVHAGTLNHRRPEYSVSPHFAHHAYKNPLWCLLTSTRGKQFG